MSEFVCEPLDKKHDRQRFRCGVAELDEWLQRRARQDQDRQVAAVHVLVPKDEPARIAGFYTLSAAAIVLTDLPQAFIRKLPRYPIVPAVLIGRLARDVDFAGMGERLLMDALQLAARHSTDIAAAAVVVDAKDERASRFYRRYGFEPLTDSPGRLFISMASVQCLFPP
jgi:predicted GNAT family N-acyltransferase